MSQKIIKSLIDEGLLIAPDFLENITPEFETEKYLELLKKKKEEEKLLFITGKVFSELVEDQKAEGKKEKQIEGNNQVIIKSEFEENSKKKEAKDFTSYFRARYNTIKEILQNRAELSNVISINCVLNKKDKEKLALIGLVFDKKVSKNGNILLTVEDITGQITVLVRKDKRELYEKAQDIVLDDVLGITGTAGNGIVFANNVFSPEVPVYKELKKGTDDIYAAFISDIHVGSDMFLKEDFERFIEWTNGKVGSEEQREISKKLKYLFIAGDICDGVGIYPGQEEELLIKDIREQYKKCAEYLSMIRPDIQIILCAGNHDGLRIAEPQPVIDKDLAKEIYELPNVTLVPNPSFINIHSSEHFSGFDVLLYHGYSFDHYVRDVDSIRLNGGYDQTDLIMKFLLQKRHLAPTHGSTLYVPYSDKDPLVITRIPDFFVSGHVHKAAIKNYNNITLICGSCWQAKTSFQEKVGHEPEPAKVPVVHLKTRKFKMLNFSG